MNRFTVLAVNDEKDYCECCGKSGLKRVVWIEDADTSEIKHFGTSCAVQPVKGFGIDKEIKAAIRSHDDRESGYNAAAHAAYRLGGGKYFPMDPKTGTFKVRDMDTWLHCRQLAKQGAEEFLNGFTQI